MKTAPMRSRMGGREKSTLTMGSLSISPRMNPTRKTQGKEVAQREESKGEEISNAEDGDDHEEEYIDGIVYDHKPNDTDDTDDGYGCHDASDDDSIQYDDDDDY